MNRITQGALALAAAVVLCLGGAGSTAFWQESTATAAAAFQTGELSLAPVSGTAAWSVGGVAVSETFRAVPGTVLSYTEQFVLTMEGDDLAATVTLVPGAIATSAGSSFALTGATLTGPVAPGADDRQWTATGSGTLTLTLELTWPRGGEVDDAAQGAEISIASSQVLVAQAVS